MTHVFKRFVRLLKPKHAECNFSQVVTVRIRVCFFIIITTCSVVLRGLTTAFSKNTYSDYSKCTNVLLSYSRTMLFDCALAIGGFLALSV